MDFFDKLSDALSISEEQPKASRESAEPQPIIPEHKNADHGPQRSNPAPQARDSPF